MSILRLTPEQYAAKQAAAKRAPGGQNGARSDDRSAPSPAHLKYQNRPTGGYSSVKEARRAQELKLLRDGGQIRNLREQVPFEIIPEQRANGVVLERKCRYIADFVYEQDGREIVEDVKSEPSKTKEYRIKRKLMLLVHGIRIRET